MRDRARFSFLLVLAATMSLALPSTADAQFLKRLKDAASEAVQNEAENQVDRLVRNAIRCAIDDPICPEEAAAAGEEVIFVDDGGEIIADDEGAPITDREEAVARAPTPVAPGEGVWANYDFVPGDRIIFYDDFANDRVGDFPRRFEFIEGSWEIVESGGKRHLRASSGGLIKIPLPEELPARFTVEFDVNTSHGNSYVYLMTGPAIHGPDRSYQGSAAVVRSTGAGIQPVGGAGPESMTLYPQDFLVEFRNENTPKPLRFMADGDYVKMYLDEHRVANVPNAAFTRSDALYIAVSSLTPEMPALIGPVRIAAGGLDLYDRLEADGRVATQGILFGRNSDRIRPESTPTLEEIATMLREHAELRLSIEGHTDSDGIEGYNQDLSERRAAAVKQFLVDRHGIDEARLQTAGFGESRPVADDSTAEGKEQNRRVELVKVEPGT